ncbi:MAG: rhomboid family intramembrane serine protease [Acidobacteriota bacterium]
MTLNPITREPQFRECPACGNQTPAESAACVHCGALSVEAAVAAREAATESRFLRALFTRSNPFTMIFIGINLGVFGLMCLAGGVATMSVDPEVLRGFGAKQNNLITEQHQYWRLITSIFIHIGFIHLFLNNYALWIIGQEIEQIYGSARFVVLYLITGVIGSLGSYVFNPDATSAGASGAIFGLFGVMATFAFKYRKEIPTLLSREIRRRVLPIIAINLVFGFSVRIVDNAAHIGGLLAGIALALAIPYMRPHENLTPFVWRALQISCLVVTFVSFVSIFRNYSGPQLTVGNLTRSPGSSVVTYFNRMKDANRALGESLKSVAALLETRNEAADAKPSVNFVDAGIQAINSVPRVDAQGDEYRKRLLELLTKQKNILDQFAQANTKNWKALAREEEMLRNSHNQFLSDYGKWLPGFLKEHGYELGEGK